MGHAAEAHTHRVAATAERVPGLPTWPPAARSLGLIPPETTLVGRAPELDVAEHLLVDEGVRLLTLIGAGGVGKTRLAVELADRLRHAFEGDVRVVDLSALRDPALLPASLASAFGIRPIGSRGVFDQLSARLGQRRLLVVLDNVEQVLGGAADLARVLEACPGVQVLATSREPLHLRAERRLLVQPLALPDPRQPAHEQAADPSAAVDLFARRARAIRSDFRLSEWNAATIGDICRRLDGLPLAIELAAARLSVLTPEGLLARLQQRLPLLQWHAADAPERHRALRTTFGWSYDLLDEADRVLFRRLAVFAGSFSAELAEGVVEDGAGTHHGLDALQRLVEKSLVALSEAPGAEPRFRLLETIREFALERLADAGELDQAQRWLARHLLTVAQHTSSPPRAPKPPARLAAVDAARVGPLVAHDWAAAAMEAGLELRLSPRERQVLGLMADGLSNQQIASALIVSPRTARYHVGTILNKLGASNRAQAVALGLHSGLIGIRDRLGD